MSKDCGNERSMCELSLKSCGLRKHENAQGYIPAAGDVRAVYG